MTSLDVGSGTHPRGDVNIELYYPKSRHTPGNIKKPTVLCDAHILPFRPNSFDEVHCFHTLEHLHCPFKCLTEVRRVMTNKAVLHVEQPDAAKVQWERPQHLYSWNRWTLKWLLLNVGFKVPGKAEPVGKQSLRIEAYK
jgi:ubiquinone/menaquinone biosynthesis C-methylase UbiE